MSSYESALAKVRANFPKDTAVVNDKKLKWAIETQSSLITTCNRYRVCRRTDDAGTRTYYAYTVASPTSVSKQVGGPFNEPQHAKESAQRHFENQTKELPL